jgi:predicted polyphosphate/ATP-dependent NAD kinase
MSARFAPIAAGPRLGLVVNPIAGMGGRVGLHGTDGAALAVARSRGALPVATDRARRALATLSRRTPTLSVLTVAGAMGTDALTNTNWTIVASPPRSRADTTAGDTTDAIAAMVGLVDLILFVGGDGTARDVAAATDGVPILGVPSGVKMHSGVFATGPEAAGDVAARFLADPAGVGTREAEVVDQDSGVVRLHGIARVPDVRRTLQAAKVGAALADDAALAALGVEVAREMPRGVLYLLGPGTTVAHVSRALGLESALLGVDAVVDGALAASDASEHELLALLDKHADARLVLGVVGGQGFLLGRGNQQLSAAVLRRVGPANIEVLAAAGKVAALERPILHVDLDDADMAAAVSGYRRVRTAPGQSTVLRVLAADAPNLDR